MKKRYLVICVLMISLFLTSCTEADLMDNSIKGFMTVLSSDELKGRVTGTYENDLTTAYMSYKFQRFGLEPYRGDSYFHEYKQEVVKPENQIHSLSIEFMDGSIKRCTYGIDYLVQVGSTDLNISTPITFNMKDNKLSEKIAVIESMVTDGKAARTSKCIFIKSTNFFGRPSTVSTASPIIQLTEKLYNELKIKPVKNAKVLIKYTPEEITAKNVVGKICGKNNKKALVLTAHIDGSGSAGSTIFNSAVDNASGTAVILDLAQRLKEKSKEKPFEMDILFCGVNGEEYLLLGSEVLARDLRPIYDEIYNINIDCVGKKNGGKIVFGGEKENYGELINDVGRYLAKHGISIGDANYGTSDHVSFNMADICGITIGQESLKIKEYNDIHTPGDKIDNVDFEFLKKVSDSIYDFIISNSGKMYKPLITSEISGDFPDESAMQKFYEASKLERENLKYNEYKIIQIDDYKWKVTGNRPLENKEELKKYYPNINIADKILDYGFKTIYVGNTDQFSRHYSKNETVTEEIGKAYTSVLLQENIMNIDLTYTRDNNLLKLEAYKTGEMNSGDFFLLNEYDTEKITIKGNDYKLLKSKTNGSITGVYKKVILKNGSWDVILRVGKNIERQTQQGKLMLPVYEATRDEITEVMNQINIDDLIKSIGI